VTNLIHLLSPLRLSKQEVTSQRYFADPIPALFTASDLVPFIVLDIEIIGKDPRKDVEQEIKQSLVKELSIMKTMGGFEGFVKNGNPVLHDGTKILVPSMEHNFAAININDHIEPAIKGVSLCLN